MSALQRSVREIPFALVMAGGESARMRKTLNGQHKALAYVLGVPMIERVVCQLLGFNCRCIVVCVREENIALREFAENQLIELASAFDVDLDLFIESTPLGTVGAAGEFAEKANSVMIVNVDNMTDLNPCRFLSHHNESGAALTIASHVESIQIPFGELTIEAGEVKEYREKPSFPVQLSSGTYILGRFACNLIRSGERTQITDLFEAVRKSEKTVAAYPHQANWIDVNDANALLQAEKMVLQNYASFELWNREPDQRVTILCALQFDVPRFSIKSRRQKDDDERTIYEFDSPDPATRSIRRVSVQVAQAENHSESTHDYDWLRAENQLTDLVGAGAAKRIVSVLQHKWG